MRLSENFGKTPFTRESAAAAMLLLTIGVIVIVDSVAAS